MRRQTCRGVSKPQCTQSPPRQRLCPTTGRFAGSSDFLSATNRPDGLLDALSPEYVAGLTERPDWVVDSFGLLDNAELDAMVRERIGKWGAAFAMQRWGHLRGRVEGMVRACDGRMQQKGESSRQRPCHDLVVSSSECTPPPAAMHIRCHHAIWQLRFACICSSVGHQVTSALLGSAAQLQSRIRR